MNGPKKGDSTCTQIINRRLASDHFLTIDSCYLAPSSLASGILGRWWCLFLTGLVRTYDFGGDNSITYFLLVTESPYQQDFSYLTRLTWPNRVHHRVEKITDASSLAIHPLAHHPLVFPPQSCPHTLKEVIQGKNGAAKEQFGNLYQAGLGMIISQLFNRPR